MTSRYIDGDKFYETPDGGWRLIEGGYCEVFFKEIIQVLFG